MILNILFDKISIEKINELPQQVDAKNNVKILDIQKKPLSEIGEKQSALNLKFQFSVKYEPNVAKVEILGRLLYLADEKDQNAILEDWTKNKKIDPKISGPILNTILSKCNIKALVLAQDLNLPPHIPFPRIALRSEVEKKAKAS